MQYTHQGLEILPQDILFGKIISQKGRFANVWRGKWKKGLIDVAIKQPKKFPLTEQEAQCFRRELETYRNLNGAHICRFYGACLIPGHEFLVTELCQKSVSQLLEENNASLHTRLKILKETAQGMTFLHANHILHLDLKPDNILLDKYGSVKICDFGFSTTLFKTENKSQKLGTPIYTAPEVLSQGLVTSKADVYSYSITSWQILTNQPVTLNIFEAQKISDQIQNLSYEEISEEKRGENKSSWITHSNLSRFSNLDGTNGALRCVSTPTSPRPTSELRVTFNTLQNLSPRMIPSCSSSSSSRPVSPSPSSVSSSRSSSRPVSPLESSSSRSSSSSSNSSSYIQIERTRPKDKKFPTQFQQIGSGIKDLLRVVCVGELRPPLSSLSLDLQNFLMNTWNSDHTKRPEFSDIVSSLSLLTKNHTLISEKERSIWRWTEDQVIWDEFIPSFCLSMHIPVPMSSPNPNSPNDSLTSSRDQGLSDSELEEDPSIEDVHSASSNQIQRVIEKLTDQSNSGSDNMDCKETQIFLKKNNEIKDDDDDDDEEEEHKEKHYEFGRLSKTSNSVLLLLQNELFRREKSHFFSAFKAIICSSQPPYFIVTLERFGRFVNLFGPLVPPSSPLDVPLCFIKMKEILEQPWFFPDLTEDEAYRKLKDQPSGTYLLRFSSNLSKPSFVVSWVISTQSHVSRAVIHERIYHNPGEENPYMIELKTKSGLVKQRYRTLHEAIHSHGPESVRKRSIPFHSRISSWSLFYDKSYSGTRNYGYKFCHSPDILRQSLQSLNQ